MMVHLATKDDIDAMLHIERESFGARAFTRRHFERYVHDQCCYVVTADVCRIIILGYIVVFVRRNSSKARINVLAVNSVCRGRGWGTFLLTYAERFYKAKGYTHMSLEVGVENTRAIDLYHRRKYESVKYLPDFYGPEKHGIKMVKVLE